MNARSQNPYESPRSDAVSSDVSPLASPEEVVRREHINHESSINAFGLLFIVAAALLLPVGVAATGSAIFSSMNDAGAVERLSVAVLGILYLVFGVLSVISFFGLRKLRPWGKRTATFLAAIGLVLIPIGTLINGYLLYLLHSQKGKMVFSDEYKRVIVETPHVRSQTSRVALVGLAVLILLLVGGCVAGLLLG